MHTFKAINGTSFIFNADFSGDVEIMRGDGAEHTFLPAEDLLQFVAESHIRGQLRRKFDEMDWRELMFGKVS